MVYILGRGFLATGLAVMSTAGMLHLAHPASEMLDTEALVISHVLMAWGEALSTGMLVAVFVAFRPEWLLTYSDQRYLPRPKP